MHNLFKYPYIRILKILIIFLIKKIIKFSLFTNVFSSVNLLYHWLPIISLITTPCEYASCYLLPNRQSPNL